MVATKSAPKTSSSRAATEWVKKYWREHPKRSLETGGRMITMGGESIGTLAADVWARKFPFGEFIRQCAFMASVAVVPTLFVAIPITVTIQIQVGGIVSQIGADSFIGAATGLGVLRQGAPLVTVLMISGAVGSAICADLGSRTIREEIDAMRVMGVDPMRRLVAPRLAAATLVSVLLCGCVVFVAYVCGYLFSVYAQGGVPGAFINAFSSFADANDLLVSLVKALIFGLIAAIIACHAGLSTKGGPGGVANSVNTAVVTSAIVLFAVNIIITQLYNTLFPTELV